MVRVGLIAPLDCNAVVVTTWPTRNRVLVQFAGDGPLVGFSGYLRDGTIRVDHMQMDGAARVPATGFCKIRPGTILCAGRIARTVGAVVRFRRDR